MGTQSIKKQWPQEKQDQQLKQEVELDLLEKPQPEEEELLEVKELPVVPEEEELPVVPVEEEELPEKLQLLEEELPEKPQPLEEELPEKPQPLEEEEEDQPRNDQTTFEITKKNSTKKSRVF